MYFPVCIRGDDNSAVSQGYCKDSMRKFTQCVQPSTWHIVKTSYKCNYYLLPHVFLNGLATTLYSNRVIRNYVDGDTVYINLC